MLIADLLPSTYTFNTVSCTYTNNVEHCVALALSGRSWKGVCLRWYGCVVCTFLFLWFVTQSQTNEIYENLLKMSKPIAIVLLRTHANVDRSKKKRNDKQLFMYCNTFKVFELKTSLNSE